MIKAGVDAHAWDRLDAVSGALRAGKSHIKLVLAATSLMEAEFEPLLVAFEQAYEALYPPPHLTMEGAAAGGR